METYCLFILYITILLDAERFFSYGINHCMEQPYTNYSVIDIGMQYILYLVARQPSDKKQSSSEAKKATLMSLCA